MSLFRIGLVLSFFAWSPLIFAKFMPDNDLHLEQQKQNSAIDEAVFNTILDSVKEHYEDIVADFGYTLKINRFWNNDTVNASANQSAGSWVLNMYGGLARRNEVTFDGFLLVACHELGHHLGGVVFYSPLAWAASEGQSDYFATIACARKIWADEPVINATFKEAIKEFQGGEEISILCDTAYETIEDQNICYRSAVAGKSLGDLLSALGNAPVPQFNTPDTKVIEKTLKSHPNGQCRLDTYVAGALCKKDWDDTLIPGKSLANRENLLAFIAAEPFACHAYLQSIGFRPHCWFDPMDVDPPSTASGLLEVEMDLQKDEVGEIETLAVDEGDELEFTMTGSGDADLYVRFNEAPTGKLFDCRPYKGDSEEICNLKIPSDVTKVFAHVVGWGPQSRVKVTIVSKIVAKLCRNHNLGVGEPFDCYEEYLCKTIDATLPDDITNQCIDY